MGNVELSEKIRNLLEKNNIHFKEVDHTPSTDCFSSASARGESLKIGGKTILFKDKSDYRLFVLSAALQVDSNKVRKILNSQKLRFATGQELMEKIGVEKGALPPFGRDILPFDLYLDKSILENEKLAFNAGLLTKSFIINVSDYLRVVSPNICSFSKNFNN